MPLKARRFSSMDTNLPERNKLSETWSVALVILLAIQRDCNSKINSRECPKKKGTVNSKRQMESIVHDGSSTNPEFL
jgi:hypothetical protein